MEDGKTVEHGSARVRRAGKRLGGSANVWRSRSGKTIGEIVAWLREHRGWSRNELAVRSGLSHTHVRAIELGKHSPSLDVLHAIAEAIGVGLSFMLDDGRAGGPIDQDAVQLAMQIQQLPDRQRRFVAEAIQYASFPSAMRLAAS